jgi:hypothetical protein
MEYSNELMSIAKEGMSASEFTKFQLSMESEKISFDVHKQFLSKIISQIASLFKSKPSRSKIIDQSIVDSNGDIDKVKDIQITRDVNALLLKSKDTSIRNKAKALDQFYHEIKKRKVQWLKTKALITRSNSLSEATIAEMLYLTNYVIAVEAYIRAVSGLLVEMNNPNIFKRYESDNLIAAVEKLKNQIDNGNLDKSLNFLLKKEGATTEAIDLVVFATLGVVVAIITLLFTVRILVYYFYYTRMQISDYFEQQARFLDLHKSEIKNNSNLTQVERNNIVTAQKAWADRFMAISELIADDEIASVKKVSKTVKESNKDLNSSNVIDAQNTGMDFF